VNEALLEKTEPLGLNEKARFYRASLEADITTAKPEPQQKPIKIETPKNRKKTIGKTKKKS